MIFNPVQYLPYSYRDMTPGVLGYGWGIMVHYKDVIGVTRGTHHIEEFYKGRVVLIGLPVKRFKSNLNYPPKIMKINIPIEPDHYIASEPEKLNDKEIMLSFYSDFGYGQKDSITTLLIGDGDIESGNGINIELNRNQARYIIGYLKAFVSEEDLD